MNPDFYSDIYSNSIRNLLNDVPIDMNSEMTERLISMMQGLQITRSSGDYVEELESTPESTPEPERSENDEYLSRMGIE